MPGSEKLTIRHAEVGDAEAIDKIYNWPARDSGHPVAALPVGRVRTQALATDRTRKKGSRNWHFCVGFSGTGCNPPPGG